MRFDKSFITKTLPQLSIAFGNFPDNATFSIDSREVKAGDIFIALKGAEHDGHEFVAQALQNGAVGLIIAESKKDILNEIKNLETKLVLLVKDPLEALFQLAAAWRLQFNYPVIAITGSVGKTSTKEILSQIMLHANKKYFVSHGNQNTKIGLALNILRMKIDHELTIFELGISKRSEMADLACLLRPTSAMITNIGHQHMDGLGSLNDIALEKRDVFKYFIENNIGIINGDQQILAHVSYQHPVIKFGSKTTNQIQARKIRVSGSHINFVLKIYKKKYSIVLDNPHVGAVFNVLAATAAAHWLGISDEIIIKAVQKPCIIEGRFEERLVNGNRGILINDCYNANPESMKAALLAFQQIETKSPKIAILGDMLGLGVNSPFWHRQVGRFLRKVPSLNKVILVGNLVSWIKKTAPVGLRIEVVESWQDAVHRIENELNTKPAILVKASRAIGLENLVSILTTKSDIQSSQL
ncbi:MAG TPA: UDP-N-acetylmuramoyl-tripeptide--D-alanyl-D-alanine ligase [Candidatus Babeliales bacterium]|nr:UDP-N-acetylmuramoyl-tripeptide--D-alanyl-D-alanine ligase [Candidatus Babeliales bacterium]